MATTNLTRWLVAIGLVLAAAAEAAAVTGVPWRELRFEGRKLLMKAEAVVRVRSAEAEAVVTDLAELPHDRALMPAGAVVVVEVSSDLPLDRQEVTTSWVGLGDGRALQAEKLVSGRKNYWKRKRFSDIGYHQWRAEPGSKTELGAGRSAWTGTAESDTVFSPAPGPRAVADPYALLYLIAAADLGRQGARHTVVIPSDESLVELELTTVGSESRRIELSDERDGTRVVRSEPMTVWRVRGEARRLSDGSADDEVETGLLGIRGGLELLVLSDGTPVEISGRAKNLGRITVRLTRRVMGGG